MNHPQVYVPAARKEVHYFDRYYDRGLPWYESFFPAQPDPNIRAVGEITPHYLYCYQCPERILQLSTINKLIVLLRNPIERTFSNYLFRIRVDNFQGDFNDFLAAYPQTIKWGFYTRYLHHYLNHFRREQILILLHEDLFRETDDTLTHLARFLDIEPDLFSADTGKRVNPSYIPRFPRAYALAVNIGSHLRHHDFYWLLSLARRLGVNEFFGQQSTRPAMTDEIRRQLLATYDKEIDNLATFLETDLSLWKATQAQTRS